MGLLDGIREKRKYNLERMKNEKERKAKLQLIFDEEIEKNAAKVIKERAKREAMARYGYSKHERRMKMIQAFAKGVQGVGEELRSLNPPQEEKKKQKPKDPNDFDIGVM
jgi:transcription termination factor NusB